MSSLRINNNISALNAHRNLQKTDRAMGRTLATLSSGLKVRTAADGPAALVSSEAMRAQVKGLNQAVNNSEMAVALVQTADGALNEANSILLSMRQLAVHASNEGANDEAMLAADQLEIANSLKSIDRIARNTQFGTKRLLDGTRGVMGVTGGKKLEYIKAGTETKMSPVGGYAVEITQAATHSFYETNLAMTQDMIDAGEGITMVSDGQVLKFKTDSDMTVGSMVNQLNKELFDRGMNMTVEKLDDNRLKVIHNEFGSNTEFFLSSDTVGLFSEDGPNVPTRSIDGLDVAGNIGGEEGSGDGQYLMGMAGTNVEGLVLRYTGSEYDRQEIADKIGVNLHSGLQVKDGEALNKEAATAANIDMNGDHVPMEGEDLVPVEVGRVTVAQNSLSFQVGANQDQTVRMSIQDTSSRTLGKGVQNLSEYRSIQDIDVTSFQGAQDALKVIDKAIKDVSTLRGEFGAFQKNTLESNIANLRIASENLTSSESLIRDADMAGTMAEFTKNQIQGQAGMAMLAQANQLPNQVMTLLG